MDRFAKGFKNIVYQPQLFSLIVVTLILVIFALVVYYKSKNQKPNVAPEGILLVAEYYVVKMDSLFDDATSGKLPKPAPYIFTLITFLCVSNVVGLIGLEPPTTSYSVTLTLGLVSWIGIYVVGIIYHKLHFFKKFVNPIEMISQFSPLISISFRIFGNLIGGSTIMFLLYFVTGYFWSLVPIIGEVNLLGPLITPFFHLYFDLFGGLVQAYVFTLLTMIYWSMEVPENEIKDEVKKTIKNKKTRKLQHLLTTTEEL